MGLQAILNNCSNEGDGELANFFCEEEFLTYRDDQPNHVTNKYDFYNPILLENLKKIQPTTPLNARKTIVDEETNIINELPRGSCSGTLIDVVNVGDDDDDNNNNNDDVAVCTNKVDT